MKMIFKLFTVAPVILLAVSAQAIEKKPELFECGVKTCDWVKINEKTLVKQDKGASLYKVELIWGESSHKKGRAPKFFSKKIPIRWREASKDQFSVFCYNKLPVYIIGNEFNILNFKFSDTHAIRTAAMEYVRVCYDAPWNAALSGTFLKEHNLSEPMTEDVAAKTPEDLFQYVK